MANEVKIDVELRTSKATSSAKKLNSTLQQVANNFNKTQSVLSKIGQQLNNSNNVLQKMKNNASTLSSKLSMSSNSTNKMKNDLKTSDIYAKSMAESATQISKALASIYLGTQFVQAAETYGAAVNKLNNINAQNLGSAGVVTTANGEEYSQATKDMTTADLNKIYNSAQLARTSFSSLVGNVGKQMLLAGDAFNNNMDTAIKFNELMAKTYAISGSTTEEQLASMTQLTQALGAGVMQGDELKSVREGATMAYQAIEKFAQSLYDTDESLKDLGAEGLITSDIVVAAILENADAIDRAMGLSTMTVGQFWTMFKNTAFYSFSESYEAFQQFLGKLASSPIYEIMVRYLGVIGKALTNVFKIGTAILDLMSKYESTITPILETLAFVVSFGLGSALVKLQLQTLKTIAIFLGFGKVLTPQFLFIMSVMTAMSLTISVLSGESLSANSKIAASLTGTLGVLLLIKGALLLLRSPILGIGTITLGVLSLIMTRSIITKDSIIEGVADIVARVVAAVVYIKSYLEYFSSVVATTFMNVAGIIATTFSNLVTMAMNTISNLVTALNSLKNLENPFKADYKSLTDGVESIDSVIKKNESTILKTPTYNQDALSAYNSVYDKIVGIGNSLFGGFGTSNSSGSYGLDYQSPDVSDMLGNISDTADNTENISSDLKLVTQDLSFLKDLAELEWKKEFTTASINVSMTNNNNIANKNDIGDIATILKNQLQTELKTVAAGSYS